MAIPTIFELCEPRADVLAGSANDDFAADLAQVIRGGGGPATYGDPVRFFANTYPTRGLKNLLANVCGRLSGSRDAVAAIFRLDTSFGGGKTHGLIALVHAARGMQGVADAGEFVDPALIPAGRVRVAAFDGENADPANGRRMCEDVLAFTPWGELAFALAGRDGYERVRRSDEEGVAPGAETLAELFGGQPSLILLDELSLYLRKVKSRPHARDQLTAFLTSLFKAVEASPRAALVYTLAIGKGGETTDAYGDENRFIADRMAEAESVSARKATLLNPTEDHETVHVLRRRLFARVDAAGAAQVVAAYHELWRANRESLSPEPAKAETAAGFADSYPLHPDLLATFTGKTATLANFQRVRGMLRILGRTVARLWELRPADATAIHLHHVDPGFEPVRQEIVTRLGQGMYVAAIRNDVAGEPGKRALAEAIDEEHHRGLPPYAGYVARTVLLHSLAFNDQLKGVTPERLRYAVLGPRADVSFVEAARQKFVAGSAYLDDRPGAPLRFLTEANLTQVIHREERGVDQGELRAQLNDRIRTIFKGDHLEAVPFPGGPWDVPDEVGNGRPLLVVVGYEAVSVGASVEAVPELVARIHERKGSEGGSLRALRNNLVFIVAEEGRVEDMRQKTARRLALAALKAPDRLADLAEHQQAKIKELEARSEHEVALAVQQGYRHLFYPSQASVGGAGVQLAHTALDIHSASEKPGAGQQQVVRALRELRKLRLPEDEPDAPAYVRDRTPLKKGQITTHALRDEFRRDVALPMLVGDDVFIKGVRRGVEQGEYVYRRGELLCGQGDPSTSVTIDEQSVVFTMGYAREHGIWPRPKPAAAPVAVELPGAGEQPATGLNGGGNGHDSGAGRGPPTPPGGPGAPDAPAAANGFVAEGVLREALTRLWEQARARRVERLASLSIRMFDATDAFRLLGVVAAVRGAESKRAIFTGGYETADGSTVELEYRGTPGDAQPLKEFLELQLRTARDKDLHARFEFAFGEGLPLAADAPEKLAEQLTRFATGAAFVEATAEAKT